MAVNILCPKCKSTFVIGTKSCKKCRNNLQKNRLYYVRLKQNGKWISRTVESLETARQLEAKYKDDAIRRDELGIVEPPTIDTVWKQFYSYLEMNTKSAMYYEKFWRIHIKQEFEGRYLNTITPTDLDEFTAKLQAKCHPLSPNAKGKIYKPLSPSTIANILKTLRRLYDFATLKGLYLGSNPTKKIELPKYDNKLTNSLTDDELKNLIATLRSWRNRTIALAFLMCLVTGKRTGEVFGLTWEDVNFEAGMVRFEIKSRLAGEYQYIPMNALCRSILKEIQALVEARKRKRERDGIENGAVSDCPLVFHTRAGKPIHYRALWVRIKNTAGLRDCIRPHDLRHTFASRLANTGEVDIYTLQNLLGHKTISMTQRYAHLLDDALKRGICVADKVFSVA